MRITGIRNKDGKKPETNELLLLINKLEYAVARAGFITEVTQVNGSSVKVGMHMCSFRVDTERLGYNARVNDYTVRHTKAGYKRTATPTWTQREEFNHIVNNVMDALTLSGSIKSGDYIVRTRDGRVNEWSMPHAYDNGFRLQVPSVLEIVPLKYASDATEWVGVNAPFVGAVPKAMPRFMPRKLRLIKSA
jgi:hypothetical protein